MEEEIVNMQMAQLKSGVVTRGPALHPLLRVQMRTLTVQRWTLPLAVARKQSRVQLRLRKNVLVHAVFVAMALLEKMAFAVGTRSARVCAEEKATKTDLEAIQCVARKLSE